MAFVINAAAENHACGVLNTYGIQAKRNNTTNKLDPDLVLPELDQYADEKSTFNYGGLVKFDAISTFRFINPPAQNKLNFIDHFNREVVPYLYNMSDGVTFEQFLTNNPFIALGKVGSVLSPVVSYGVHHLIRDKRAGRTGNNWQFTTHDRCIVFDYNVIRRFLYHDWSYFKVNRKAESGKGDHWESAYFAVPFCHLPKESILFDYQSES